MKHSTRLRCTIVASAFAIGASALLAACGTPSTAGADDAGEQTAETVKIGVVGASDPYWETFKSAAADAGITVELVDFADYNQPNPALSEGELDLNQFQHIQYLAEYNVANNDTLVPIGSTAVYPLGLFSTKYSSVDEIPEGGTIAIPEDPSNRARALNVLQSAGLLTLEDGGTFFSTPDDVEAETSRVEVTEMDASFTASSLQDVDGAVVNNDFVTDAGLEFSDALFQDSAADESAKPFINIFAARADDAKNDTYLKLVDIYQTNADVQAGVLENSGGSANLVNTAVSELQEILNEAEDRVRENS